MDLLADPTRSTFVLNLAIPLATFLLNVVVRWAVKVPQSSPADFILVFLVFDFSVLANPDIALTGILAEEIRKAATWWFVGLAIFGLAVWVPLLARLDGALSRYYSMLARNDTASFPWVMLMIGWGISGVYVYTHLLLFTYRGATTF